MKESIVYNEEFLFRINSLQLLMKEFVICEGINSLQLLMKEFEFSLVVYEGICQESIVYSCL